MPLIAPSILSADLLKLAKQVRAVEENGADYLHVDVMDGRFVPNITFGPVIVRTLKKITNLPLDVHLMIVEPQLYIGAFAEAGADIITVHQEACIHLDRILNQIKDLGCKAGVALNPATPLQAVEPILEIADLLLVMSVNPGFGGQKFIGYTLDKMRKASELRSSNGFSFLLEVDGGVNEQTAKEILKKGVDILVAGNAIFGAPDAGQACAKLKNLG